MRVFVAGATGAIGKRLIPLLVEAGHSVTGMTRSESNAAALRSAGADAVIADALDPAAVENAVRRAKPEVIVHELTSIPADFDLRKFGEQFETTNRLRTKGTDYLLAAAKAAGVQTFRRAELCRLALRARWWSRENGRRSARSNAAGGDARNSARPFKYLESAVTHANGIEGVVLRYGGFYGPGNAIGEGGAMLNEVRQRRVPIIGGGTGVWSFIHIDDAARATLAAVERGRPGIYNIVDDDPAPVSEWLPGLA